MQKRKCAYTHTCTHTMCTHAHMHTHTHSHVHARRNYRSYGYQIVSRMLKIFVFIRLSTWLIFTPCMSDTSNTGVPFQSQAPPTPSSVPLGRLFDIRLPRQLMFTQVPWQSLSCINRRFTIFSRKIWWGLKIWRFDSSCHNCQIKIHQYFCYMHIHEYIHVIITYRITKLKSANAIFYFGHSGPNCQYFRRYSMFFARFLSKKMPCYIINFSPLTIAVPTLILHNYNEMA